MPTKISVAPAPVRSTLPPAVVPPDGPPLVLPPVGFVPPPVVPPLGFVPPAVPAAVPAARPPVDPVPPDGLPETEPLVPPDEPRSPLAPDCAPVPVSPPLRLSLPPLPLPAPDATWTPSFWPHAATAMVANAAMTTIALRNRRLLIMAPQSVVRAAGSRCPAGAEPAPPSDP